MSYSLSQYSGQILDISRRWSTHPVSISQKAKRTKDKYFRYTYLQNEIISKKISAILAWDISWWSLEHPPTSQKTEQSQISTKEEYEDILLTEKPAYTMSCTITIAAPFQEQELLQPAIYTVQYSRCLVSTVHISQSKLLKEWPLLFPPWPFTLFLYLS